jgi:hypothetical protein
MAVTPDHIFDVELVSNLISSMANGKAAGLDELSCEHLKFSHLIVVLIPTKLFNLFVSNAHIPDCFGTSYTVPIPNVMAALAPYQQMISGISMSPVVSKLFEIDILTILQRLIVSLVFKKILVVEKQYIVSAT